MWIITICLLAGHPCVDRPKEGLHETQEACTQKVQEIEPRYMKKYKGAKIKVSCRELWILKLTFQGK